MGGHGGDPEAEGHGLLGYIIGIKGKWEGKMKILEVEHVTKSFRKKKVIDGISFSVGEGKVVGFVGPNGAGKTTTLKLVTNILIPDSGSIHIAGFNILKEREKALANVAGVIENPALYMELSGYDNLRFIQRAYGKSKSDMEQVIEMIGLGHAMRQKTGRYSLGMKQRLGLGMALLADPKFLILDEPTNGLDASGIIELRALICRKAKEGTTVLLSSHILSELYLLATDYIIIHKGHVIEELSHTDLEAKCRKYIQIQSDNLPKCSTVLEKELGISDYRIMDDHTMRVYEFVDKPQKISYVFMDHGIVVSGLSVSEQTIEEYFLSVTEGGWNNEPAKD